MNRTALAYICKSNAAREGAGRGGGGGGGVVVAAAVTKIPAERLRLFARWR